MRNIKILVDVFWLSNSNEIFFMIKRMGKNFVINNDVLMALYSLKKYILQYKRALILQNVYVYTFINYYY